MTTGGREDRNGWGMTVAALSLAALVISAFAMSLVVRETLRLRQEVDVLDAQVDILQEGLGEEDHAGHEPQLAPTVEFTLLAYMSGFVGAGGTVDGVVNPLLAVGPGDIVAMTVINGENIEHDFVIDELAVHSDHLHDEGSQDTIVFIVPASGAFDYYCSVPGHRERGMEGSLQVGS